MLVASVVALAMSQLAGPAWAAPDGWVDCDRFPDAEECDLTAQTNNGGLVVGPGGRVRCYWEGEEIPCRDRHGGWWWGNGCFYEFITRTPPSGVETPGASYQRRCYDDPSTAAEPADPFDPPGGLATGPLIWVPDSQAAGGPAMLARVATSRLPLPRPEVELAPPLPAAQLVGLPTWWWIDGEAWQARSASASVPGVTVTAVGTPTTSLWQTGDGEQVPCPGPGTPYPAGGADPAAGSDCGHTYQQSSAAQPGGTYQLTVSITWEVTWSGGGMSGVIGPLFTTTTVEVPVAEVQAVIVP